MKKLLVFGFLLVSVFSFSQTNIKSVDENYKDFLSSIEKKVDSLLQDPDNWDMALDLLEKELTKKDSSLKWLSDLNIDFKSFQNADSSSSSLGFSYDLNIERAKIMDKDKIRIGKSISFESKGNVAFKKELNPADFLSSKLAFNLFYTGGGTVVKDTTVTVKQLSDWRRKMAMYKSSDEIINSEEWKKFNDVFSMKNSWILKTDLNTGFESNQDFSKTQYTFGLRFGAGIKAWDDDNALAKWNLIDYPFAVIRRITGYDKKLKASGATIPSILLGLDYVNPLSDSVREKLEGELKPLPRVNFEIGYRTVITKVASQTIFFNCSYKYYMEIGASDPIKANSLDTFSYFTSSLSASSGFYVSYSYGKLPFDKKDDAIYELGFKYKFK